MPTKPPLYARVRETMIARLTDLTWKAGAALPPEPVLASELGVSQGTLRKAVDSLCDDGALQRVQGSGTYVVEQTPELAGMRFFRMRGAEGMVLVPELHRQIAGEGMADAQAAALLGIEQGARVHILDRVSRMCGKIGMVEHIVVPDAMMPGLSSVSPLPSALYPLYQARYGIFVMRAEEHLSAIASEGRTAKMLGVPQGQPILSSQRVATDLRGRTVEYRLSHYISDLGNYCIDLH